MKLQRVCLVGCGERQNSYYNQEGYLDPTAGCAISGSSNSYGASGKRTPEKEKIVNIKIPPVSEINEIFSNIR